MEKDSLKMLKWCSGNILLIVFTLKRYFPQTSVANVVIFSLDLSVFNWEVNYQEFCMFPKRNWRFFSFLKSCCVLHLFLFFGLLRKDK